MKNYVFENKDIQKKWEVFYPSTWKELRDMKSKMPENINSRTRDLEGLLEKIMIDNERMADLVAQVGQFRDVAYSEAVMGIYERFPKQSTTLIKAEAEGLISQVTYLLAFSENVFKVLERNSISAQALLKRSP